MNSFTIGQVQSLPVSTTTNNQCAFSNTFTNLRARGLSQHPANTATLLISIDGDSTIAVGGSIVDSLPIATPTSLGVMYGALPSPTDVNSSLSLGANAIAAGSWSIAIGNEVLTSAESSSQCNVAVGSYNLENLTTGQFNTAIVGWCQEREKMDWQEACKFDCRLVWRIFIFCCPLSIFTRRWRVARKSNFDS